MRKCVSPGAGAGIAGQGRGRTGATGEEEEEEGSGRRRGSAAVEIALSAATWLCATILHEGPAGGVGHSVRGCADRGDRGSEWRVWVGCTGEGPRGSWECVEFKAEPPTLKGRGHRANYVRPLRALVG